MTSLPSAQSTAAVSRLTMDAIDLGELTESAHSNGNGATVVFVGTVRNNNVDREVTAITYTAYESMAEQRLATIISELEEDHPGVRVAVTHRLGRLVVGEASVAIAVSSPHRDEAYRINRRALERLKSEVPIWKLEHYREGDDSWREVEKLTEQASNPHS